MNPLILSLICLLLVGVSANWLSIVKSNKTLIYLSLASTTVFIIKTLSVYSNWRRRSFWVFIFKIFKKLWTLKVKKK